MPDDSIDNTAATPPQPDPEALAEEVNASADRRESPNAVTAEEIERARQALSQHSPELAAQLEQVAEMESATVEDPSQTESNATTLTNEEIEAALQEAQSESTQIESAVQELADTAADVEISPTPAPTPETAATPEAAQSARPTEADSAAPFEPPDLDAGAAGEDVGNIGLLDDVELDVKVELGRTELYIEEVLRLGAGSVVELDQLAGDPVDVYVNERLVARGEVLVLNENFCVRINEIVSPVPELEGS